MTDKEVMQMALDVIETYGLDYMHGLSKKYYVIALRAALEQPQREWQGLTDEEIMSLLPGAVRLPPGWADTVRAIEGKLKKKNYCSTNNHKENSNEETK